jgi:hypothetical protein
MESCPGRSPDHRRFQAGAWERDKDDLPPLIDALEKIIESK